MWEKNAAVLWILQHLHSYLFTLKVIVDIIDLKCWRFKHIDAIHWSFVVLNRENINRMKKHTHKTQIDPFDIRYDKIHRVNIQFCVVYKQKNWKCFKPSN